MGGCGPGPADGGPMPGFYHVQACAATPFCPRPRSPRQLRAAGTSDTLGGHPAGPAHGPSTRAHFLPPRHPMTSPFLEALRERILFYDGAMGTQLQARNLGPEDFGGARWEGCNDYLSLTRPDVVESIHDAYFAAGADVVETNSFQASRIRLEEWGLAARTLELNRA